VTSYADELDGGVHQGREMNSSVVEERVVAQDVAKRLTALLLKGTPRVRQQSSPSRAAVSCDIGYVEHLPMVAPPQATA
jgi:hypothetical protein